MILHDGGCHEFEIEHVGLPDANVWGMSSKARKFVQPETPVVGWRYTTISHIGGLVVGTTDVDGVNPTFWDNTFAAPRAECVPEFMGPRGSADIARRVLTHGQSPDPDCECGYRVVKSVTELGRFLRWGNWTWPDKPVADLPDAVRPHVEHLGDWVAESAVLHPVVGCGGVAGGEYTNYRDPVGTVRVEYFGSPGRFIANADDPVVGALRAWGATVVVVPDICDVHEPGDCGSLGEKYECWW